MLVFLLLIASGICAAASVEELLESRLIARLHAIEQRVSGVTGWSIIDLETGRLIEHNAGALFPQASSIKIPVMIQAFEQAREGRIKLGQTVTLAQTDAVGGSGHLRLILRSRPVTLTVEELVTAMIETSDNTATNKLIALLGMERVNAMLDRLGMRETRLKRVMLDAGAAARNEENVSTPHEMAKLMELIYRGKAVDAESSRRMIDILKLVAADFRAAVPATVPVAAKPGELTGVRAETGVVFVPGRPFILSVGATFLDEPDNPIRDIARAVYEHFAKLSRSNRYGNGGVR